MEGRIIKGVGGLYFVAANNNIFECTIRGIFRKRKIVPTIGDFVKISKTGSKYCIDEIFERKNLLIRPSIANVDQAVIVFSVKSPNLNMDLLDRFLILAEEQNLEVIICINKKDLSSEDELSKIISLYENVGYNIFCTDTFSGNGIEKLKQRLSQKVTVFAGPSGVGKSSIANCIMLNNVMETGEISQKIGRGKHTTRHVELLNISENSYLADTPGFSSLSLSHISKEKLPYLFKEFKELSGKCKFSDCKHLNEPNCAVKEQIGKHICVLRYERYVGISEELSRGEKN